MEARQRKVTGRILKMKSAFANSQSTELNEISRSKPLTTQFQSKAASELWLNIAGRDYRLVGKSIRIGRAPDNDIVVDHKSCSRYHALITLQNNQVIIEDLKSRNGVKVNSAPIRIAELKGSDQIRV